MADTIRVRTLDVNGDAMRGAGLSNFSADLMAVAQIILTRLKLLQGEWFEDLNQGTPLFQQLLGKPTTSDGILLVLRERILGTPYVTGISNIGVTYQGSSRAFTFSATVQTQFGSVSVATANPPTA